MSDSESPLSDKIHYGCSLCLKVFNSEEDCDKHVATCVNTFESGTASSSIKRKLSGDSSGSGEPPKRADTVQYATSHMLSENEMLITLPSDTTINLVEKDSDAEDDSTFLFYDPPSGKETIIVEDTTTSTGKNVKVLSLLSVKDFQQQSLNDLEEKTSSDIDVFTLGNPTNITKQRGDKTNTKKQTLGRNQGQKRTLEIDENNKKSLVKAKTKMYKKILQEDTSKEEEQKEPNEFSVYDFRDEEEENWNQCVEEMKKKEQDLKERTCKDCKKVFDDPMAVLCHRREYHKRLKIYVSAEEIEEYKNVPDRTKCPVCLKTLSKRGYLSSFLNHLKTHSSSYDFECKICGLRFRRKDHWQNHESRHVVSPSEVNIENNKGQASA